MSTMRSCFARADRRAGDRAGNRLREIEQTGVLALAEILRLEEFRQADDLGAARGGLMDLVDGPLQIFVGIGRRRHLHQSDLELVTAS